MGRVKIGFLVEFASLKDVIARSRDEKAGKAWLRAKRFIEAGKYSTTAYHGDFAKCIMAGYDDAYLVDKFGIALETVRGHRRRISKKLEDIFGADFVDMFYAFNDNESEINRRLDALENIGITAVDVFPRELLPYDRNNAGKAMPSFRLEDCTDEMAFLGRYSLGAIEKDRKELDNNKLLFLYDVIDGACGSFAERTEVMRVIRSYWEE